MRMHNNNNNNNNNTPPSSNDDDDDNNNNSNGNNGNGGNANNNNNNNNNSTMMHHQGNDDYDDYYYHDFAGSVSGKDDIICQLLERGLNPDLLFPTLMDNHTTTSTAAANDIQQDQQQQQHTTSSSSSNNNNAFHHANNNNMMIVENNMNNYNNDNNNYNVENDTPPVILLPPSSTTSSSSLLLLASSSTTTSSSNQEEGGATTTTITTSTSTRTNHNHENDKVPSSSFTPTATSQCDDDDNNNNNNHRTSNTTTTDLSTITTTTTPSPMTTTTTNTTTSAKTRNINNIQQQIQQQQQLLLRKHPTGLGNLGNTCFMNSTLQCLAHTPPLRNYFLSGAYEKDLNVDNPLGTGGELAREFASLMREMWWLWLGSSSSDGDAPSTITGTAGGGGSNGIYASSRMYSPGNGGSYPTTTTTTTFHSLSNGDIGGGGASSSSSSSTAPPPPPPPSSTVTYPRSFKSTLGKHAPQFIGYDQHDSQELAIYLLDALHEDTNRIRTNHKPYVENPEQSTSETDTYAAQRAWEVHLQREDSFIVHNFMGQIKSRLQCPNNNISDTNGNDAVLVVKEGEEEKEKEEKKGTCCCGRVSTTFDPCMYLSVPIPGSTDRVMKVVFVPCLFSSSSSSSSSSSLGRDGKSTTRCSVVSAEFTIQLCKNSTIKSLRREVVKSARECYGYTEEDLDEEDVQLVDIFSNKIWSYYDDLDRAIDGIKDSDVTYAYQLFPLKRVKEEVARYRRMIEDCSTSDDEVGCGSSTLGLLDAAAKAELDTNNKWENKLLKFVAKPTAVCHMLNEKKSNHKERVDFYGSLIKFIQRCQQCPDATADGSKSIDGDTVMASPSASSPTKRLSSSISQPTLEEVSYTSSQFKGVHTPRDLAILEYCVSKYLARINKLNRIASNRSSIAKEYKMAVSSASTDDVVNKNENGLEVQIKIRKNDSSSSSSAYNYGKYSSYPHDFAWKVVGDVPMVVRIAPTLTVSGLRQLLGQQLLHSCCTSNATSEDNPSNDGGCNHHPHHHLVEDDQNQTMEEELGCSSSPYMVLCNAVQEAAFSWEDDTSHGSGGRGGWSMGGGGSGNSMEFGSVSLDHFSSTHSPKAPDDEKKEMELVASIVKNRSTILVSWPPQFNDVLDESALCAKEEYLTVQQRKEMMEEEEEEEDEDDEKEDDMILSSAAASSSSSSSFSTSDNGNKKQKMKDKVEQTMKKKKKKGISIMDCIHKYCEMEQLDESDMWYCNQCKEHVRAWKQFHLYRTPPILIVHLKRFHYSSTTHRRDKIDTLIDFPLTDLDLRSVVKHNHWEVGQEPIYDCYAVSNHFGGLGGGHYTAYARWGGGGGGGGEKEVGGEDGSESSWCLFDDSRVTACVEESEVVSSAAYCLYYKRKDVVFDGNDVKDVEKDNEKLMRVSTVTTETMIKDQLLGVNHPNVSDTEGVVGLVSRMMPVRPATSTQIVEDDSPTLPLPPPHVSFDDANSNDAAMDEVVDDRGSSSSSSAASYVTPNTSLHNEDDGDDEMMNDIII